MILTETNIRARDILTSLLSESNPFTIQVFITESQECMLFLTKKDFSIYFSTLEYKHLIPSESLELDPRFKVLLAKAEHLMEGLLNLPKRKLLEISVANAAFSYKESLSSESINRLALINEGIKSGKGFSIEEFMKPPTININDDLLTEISEPSIYTLYEQTCYLYMRKDAPNDVVVSPILNPLSFEYEVSVKYFGDSIASFTMSREGCLLEGHTSYLAIRDIEFDNVVALKKLVKENESLTEEAHKLQRELIDVQKRLDAVLQMKDDLEKKIDSISSLSPVVPFKINPIS